MSGNWMTPDSARCFIFATLFIERERERQRKKTDNYFFLYSSNLFPVHFVQLKIETFEKSKKMNSNKKKAATRIWQWLSIINCLISEKISQSRGLTSVP